ncbi:zinc finger protein ZAT4-like [Argentina anserina]|uniref:zinc finger protein ZAT4-like n=1 Tax=Argentina anserina TaxID=57926 RepID=UPI002176810C|nr:zinc finger protein ZAT4-like [Potentilla anserina]
MDSDHKEITQVLVPDPIVEPDQPTKMPTPPESLEQHPEVVPLNNHICDICFKGFPSGQALGGHKSMHFRKSQAITGSTASSSSDPFCCLVCTENFDSKKALTEHLKCHTVHDSSNSCSTVSDETMFDDDHGVDSGPGFDLALALPAGWPRNGKRKRSAFSDCSGSDETAVNSGLDSSPESEFIALDGKFEAGGFSGLVLLAEVCAEEASGRPLVDDEIEIKYEASKYKRRRLNDAFDQLDYNCNNDVDVFKCKQCDKMFTSPQALGGHMTGHNRPKISSAEQGHDQFKSEEDNNEQRSHPRPVVNTYSRSKCAKTFSSDRALGGHMSSQCKHLNNSADENVVKDDPAEPRQVEMHSCPRCNKSFTSFRALGGHVSSHTKYEHNNNMDRYQSNSADVSAGNAEDNKNERRSLYQTLPHECEICHLSFPTGQALGGHKRKHYKGPTDEAPAKSNQQSSARRHLEVDLNEIPTLEDEDGIYEPISQ